MKIQVSPRAYAKILLHTSKYPHKAVNGVLVGEENLKEGEIYALDAIPLFHIALGLAPMLEVALARVDIHCKENGLQIVGYYQANEHINDNSPNAICYKIGEKICDHFNNGFMLMVDNTKLLVPCDEIACKCYVVQDNKWKQSDKDLVLDGGEDSLGLTTELIEAKTYQSLIDFDNHLDDITQDWLNKDINKLVEISLAT
ncbi:ER membrane protein complex subunit 8-like [Stylophora pistillata]|uniref:ER membrane protein complex subunit 8 n=1 Tax=Stylophora pistillata TaxID=50429 RepID=A0A2B4SL51_STYPI|nr:ER membrane protein complex subunit 8-like [Stylophora pistillata]PFX31404.1 ER membrane protein complex subunit 8 [Stylophora pistillata]